MPLPFDATLEDLVQAFLHDYEVRLARRRFAPLVPLNVDLSTITAAIIEPKVCGPNSDS